MHAMTQSESNDLRRLEQVVAKGKQAFIEVGKALAEIRERKLYKESHRTFAAYVEDKFGFGRQNAFHMIEAATAAENVNNCVQNLNVGQAREIAKAPPEKQSEVFNRAVEIAAEQGKKPTAKIIEQARTELLMPDEPDDDYEDVEDHADAEDAPTSPADTGLLSHLRSLIEELEPHELMVVRGWVDLLLESTQ